jgi:hypothetical protein
VREVVRLIFAASSTETNRTRRAQSAHQRDGFLLLWPMTIIRSVSTVISVRFFIAWATLDGVFQTDF